MAAAATLRWSVRSTGSHIASHDLAWLQEGFDECFGLTPDLIPQHSLTWCRVRVEARVVQPAACNEIQTLQQDALLFSIRPAGNALGQCDWSRCSKLGQGRESGGGGIG